MITIARVHGFITSLTFTVTVETVVLFVLVRFLLKVRKLKTRKIIFAGIFASFATLPYVGFVFLPMFPGHKTAALVGAEFFAFIVEALFYREFLQLNMKRSFAVSLVCNASSYALGYFLYYHGLWFFW